MIYLIPGLGADHRVFETIKLEGFETTIIHWEKPFKNEPIEAYAKRLAVQVKHPSPDSYREGSGQAPIFIGYSFGGVIGAELTKLFPGSRLILMSSIASRKELPWWLRFCGGVRLNRLVSGKFMKRSGWFARWFFSLRNAGERNLFDELLRDSDPDFLPWAANAILNWKGSASHRVHHIHGDRDRLLPCRCTSADIIIKDAGHFVVVSHGEEISGILKTMLLNFTTIDTKGTH